MGLDDATERFESLMEPELRRLADRRDQRAGRGEEVRFDPVTRLVTQGRHGVVSERWYGEVLATYSLEDRILRWAWAGRPTHGRSTFAERIFEEGESRDVPQLTQSVVADLDLESAAHLVELGALAVGAEDVHLAHVDGESRFIGLFVNPRPMGGPPPRTEPPQRVSIPPPPPPPPLSDKVTPVPRAPFRSIPPIREIFEPRLSRTDARTALDRSVDSVTAHRAEATIREPAKAIFLPVAAQALSILAERAPAFQQALLVVSLSQVEGAAKRRLFVQLVVLDAAGRMRAIDPPSVLVEAATTLVDADARDGNGPWRKLSARFMPKPDGGATLHVDVV